MKEWIRHWMMRLVSICFRLRAARCSLDDRAMCLIAPHPDDDILGCGGLIAAKVQRGARVRVLFLTDGAASHPNHPILKNATLAQRRIKEARTALGDLGVPAEQVVFLNLPDGRLDRLSKGERSAAIQQLREILQDERSSRIFVPLGNEGSSEHTAANQMTAEAMQTAAQDWIEYAVWAWWDPRRLLPRLWKNPRPLRFELGPLRRVKKNAIAQHTSQTEAIPPWSIPTLPRALKDACCGPRELYFPRYPSTHVL